MKLNLTRILMAVAVYEVVAYAWNSYRVSLPGATGTMMLPFEFISNFTGGYFTGTNPTGSTVGAYTGTPAMYLPTRRLVH